MYRFLLFRGAEMFFSWSPRKEPKEGDLRGHSEKASNNSGMIATGNHYYFKFAARSTTPSETPARASPTGVQKCSDF